MQPAKDSFFMALCARLHEVNPERIALVDGELRAGLLVEENMAGIPNGVSEAFYLSWGAVKPVSESALVQTMLMVCECTCRYSTRGGTSGDGARGRELARMDTELFRICLPPQTEMIDYSSGNPVNLGTTVFWQAPSLSAVQQSANELSRKATLLLYFHPQGGVQ